MEQYLIYVVFFGVLFTAIKKPEVALAILLNINIFRAIPYVDYQNPIYGYYNESDFLLGAVLPVISFLIITLRVFLKKKIKYKVDVFDFFMALISIIMVLSILLSPNKQKSLFYTGIFFALAIPYFFVTKLYFSNTTDKIRSLNTFLVTIVFFAIAFASISLYLHNIALYPYERMTFPGVYPIPFCLFLCLAILILIIYNIKPQMKWQVHKRLRLLFSLPILAIIAFAIIKTNTRGPVFALILAFAILLLTLFRLKFNLKIVLSFLLISALGFVVLVTVFDVNEIASRFVTLTSKNSDSFSPRLVSYMDSIKIFFNNPLGISVGTFSEHSSIDLSSGQTASYPHNLFMELLSSFGVVGLLLCLSLIFFFLIEYNFVVKYQRQIFYDPMFFMVLVMLLFFFLETQFSFTLNTHKGWYLSMALYSVFKWRFIKNRIKDEK